MFIIRTKQKETKNPPRIFFPFPPSSFSAAKQWLVTTLFDLVLPPFSGVYTTNIDPKLHKVIVTGNVDVETLIKKLTKTGKPAEMWPEKPSGKEKKSGKTKNKGKANDPKSEESCSDGGQPADAASKVVSAQKHGGEASDDQGKELKNGGKTTENAPTGENQAAADHKINESGGGGTGKSGGGKKKKKKGQKGNNAEGGGPGTELSGVPASTGSSANNPGTDQVMGTFKLSPTLHEPYPYPYPYPHPSIFFPHPIYVACYSTAHPSISPVPFEIFSDENPNGCCII